MLRSWPLLVLPAFVGACNQITYGQGIGQAPVEQIDRPSPSPMRVGAVFAADPDPAAHFVILTLENGADPVDLGSYELCNADNTCVALSGTLESAMKVDAADLSLVPTAGALAVVDGNGDPAAHFAWGSHPGTIDAPYYAAALRLAAVYPKGFVRVPYPLTERLAVTAEGCADPAPAEAATPDLDLVSEPCPEPAAAPIALSAPSSTADLVNTSGVDLPLFGVRVCRPPNCSTFTRGDAIAAGATLTLSFGTTSTNTGLNLPRLAPLSAGGPLRIYAPGDAGDAPLVEIP